MLRPRPHFDCAIISHYAPSLQSRLISFKPASATIDVVQCQEALPVYTSQHDLCAVEQSEGKGGLQIRLASLASRCLLLLEGLLGGHCRRRWCQSLFRVC